MRYCPSSAWERDQEKYKSDCLRRWRQARAICKMASLDDRRDELRRVGNRYGKEWEEKLKAEVKRQWT